MIIFSCITLSDKVLGIIAKNCRQLEHLDLTHCKLITEKGISSLRQCPKLVSIVADRCNKLGDKFLNEIANWDGRITALRVSQSGSREDSENPITDQGLAVFCHATQRIFQLDISKCSELTEKSLEAIAPIAKHLTLLNISYVHRIPRVEILFNNPVVTNLIEVYLSHTRCTESCILALLHSNSRLKLLSIDCCNSLSAQVIPTITKSKSLKVLSVSGNDWVTGKKNFFCKDLYSKREKLIYYFDRRLYRKAIRKDKYTSF